MMNDEQSDELYFGKVLFLMGDLREAQICGFWNEDGDIKESWTVTGTFGIHQPTELFRLSIFLT